MRVSQQSDQELISVPESKWNSGTAQEGSRGRTEEGHITENHSYKK